MVAGQGGILMSSVNFRYRPDLPLVLQDISVQIEGGTKVSLILAFKKLFNIILLSFFLCPPHPGGHCGAYRGWKILLDLHSS